MKRGWLARESGGESPAPLAIAGSEVLLVAMHASLPTKGQNNLTLFRSPLMVVIMFFVMSVLFFPMVIVLLAEADPGQLAGGKAER